MTDMYEVTVRRENEWWIGVVDGVGATEARSFTELKGMVRDLIVVMHDMDSDDGFEVTYRMPPLPPEIQAVIEEGRRHPERRTPWRSRRAR